MSVLTAFAVLATGHRVQKLDLNDSGIWASSDADALYGRFNKSASVLDLALNPGPVPRPYQLDVLQDGNTVVARDLAKGKLIPVDPMTGTNLLERALPVAAETQVELRAGTLAALDPVTGKIWGGRVDPAVRVVDLSVLDPAGKPLAELDPAPSGSVAPTAGLSIGADGSIHAAAASGRSVVIPAAELRFDEPEYAQLPAAGLRSVQVAALGTRTAVLDVQNGSVFLPGGRTQQLEGLDPSARIQQGGADLGSVLVASASSLLRIALADGTVKAVFQGGRGAPAAPVNLGQSVSTGFCEFGAWAGVPGLVVRGCNGADASPQEVDRNQKLVRPTFRVNWGALIVNDMADGRIYDVDLQRSFDNWKAADPTEKEEDDKDQPTRTVTPKQAKPRAKPDEYGARPERTSILHVLDNDSDPAGNVLSIIEVTKPTGGATAAISPDGQSIRFHQQKDGKDTSFRYTIANQTDKAEAEVRIRARGPSDNEAPKLRAHAQTPTFAVGATGIVTMPVVGDWRDGDGDPITVIEASEGTEEVPVTSDGQIEYTAPKVAQATSKVVSFKVTDGRSEPVGGRVRVKVVGTDATKGLAPVAQPDAMRGEVGQAITVLPLANDLPGVDPANPQARLTLAADVVSAETDAKPSTDRQAGRVTATFKQEGVYFLDYTAAFGSGPTSGGRIRVDVRADTDSAPVAMPDQAVIRGQSPIMVDVLANDSDPAGGLLTVQTASPVDPESVQVAIVKGRWLRVMPLVPTLNPSPQVISYTVTNGDGRYVKGDLAVSQLPPIDPDRPLVRDDLAVVRAGDSTLIPVLSNDSTLGGSPLSLASGLGGVPAGQFLVLDPEKTADADQGDVGRAHLAGDRIRYVAPGSVPAPHEFEIEYYAQTPGGEPVKGSVLVTVNPEPGEKRNTAPAPQSLEQRAVSGDTITIPIPSSGQDPDGDSVSLVGLASSPTLGRILAVTPKGLTYQAYPTDDSVGTDTFTYTVVDRYAAVGTGRIRVAVVPPGQTQLPVALDDTITARPGVTVRVDPLGNDMLAQGDKVSLRSLTDANDQVPDGVQLAGPGGPITATAPSADAAEPLTFAYGLTGNGGDGTNGMITISGRDGYRNPPRVFDEVADMVDEKLAAANVLARAWDPDGEASALRVTATTEPAAVISGGTIKVPLLPRPQVITFEVTDGDDSTASGLLFVPARGDGVPYAKGLIEVEANSTATINLADHVVSPRGRPVRFAREKTLSTSPTEHLQVKTGRGFTSIELTTKNEYVGPASLSLEVTDGASLVDPEGRTAFVSIPVQIGPRTPVVRCPEEPQTIMAGSRGKAMDVASLCHVWTADPAEVSSLTFTAEWSKPIDNVRHATDGRALTLEAAGEALPDATGALRIGVAGTSAKPEELPVVVKAAPRPRISPVVRRDVRQGTTVTGTIKLTSRLMDQKDTIFSLNPVPGTQGRATSSFEGNRWTVTPNADSSGEMRFRLVVSDVANPARVDRQVETTLTVIVYGKPDAPGIPRPGKAAQNHAETLTWKAPKNNGAAIDYYLVTTRSDDRSWRCVSTTCTIKPLQNDTPVYFKVQAHNKAGLGPESEYSQEVRPDQPPGKVTGFTASNPRDGEITLTWNPVTGDFSPVTHYVVSAGSVEKTVRGVTSTKLTGLGNQDTTFSIWAYNRTGKSKSAASTKGWPSGPPGAFSITPIQAENLNADSSAVRIRWSAAAANGEGPVRYSVERDGSSVGGCQSVTALSCTDDSVALDGRSHTYTVTATNAPEVYTTKASESWNAEGTPTRPAAPNAAATGANRMATVSGATGDSRGPSGASFVEIYSDDSLKKTVSVNSRGDSYSTEIDAGANNGSHTIAVKLCYTSSSAGKKCSDGQGTDSVVPFGPLSQPAIDTGHSNTQVWGSATANGNGREATLTITTDDGGRIDSRTGPGALAVSIPSYDAGYSTTITFTATLTTSGTTPSRSDAPSISRSETTPPRPNPVAIFETDGLVGAIDPGRSNWHLVRMTLRDWRPNSSVYCSVRATATGLWNWQGTFGVDGNGGWGAARITSGNSSGYLMVETASFLPDSSACSQR